ncbi:MAG TPA: hypothetical protein VNK95_14680 [Caldilineaceae bacterium]|nr:hypothetical protein [Caldilineaceae bacterium]
MNTTQRERRTSNVSVWLTPAELQTARELAARRGATLTQVLRDGLYLVFEANGRLPRMTTEAQAEYRA